MKIELIIETSYETSNAISIYQLLSEGVEAYRKRIGILDDPNLQFETNWNDTYSVRVTK